MSPSPPIGHPANRAYPASILNILLVVAARLPVPLSVLDLCPVPQANRPPRRFAASVDLARHAESLGFTRYWVAEHHNLPGIASSAPAVLAGHWPAAATEAIRVGSGGVMLPNHAPLTVAEQFGTLEALHPGRIDLGIGRAPGTDRETARALRGSASRAGRRFARAARGTAGLFRRPGAEGNPENRSGRSRPRATSPPSGCSGPPATAPSWPGGSACRLPSPITSAPPAPSTPGRRSRCTGRPSRLAPPSPAVQPDQRVGAVARDAATAHWLHGSTRLAALRLRPGVPARCRARRRPRPPPTRPPSRRVMAEATTTHVVGDPATVTDALARLVSSTGADELMVTTSTFDHAARLASYELLARAADRTRPRASIASHQPWLLVDPVQVPGQIRHPGGPGQPGDPAEGLPMPRVVHAGSGDTDWTLSAEQMSSRVVGRSPLEHLQQ